MAGAMEPYLALLRAGERSRFVEKVTSGSVWNHMGSLFDNDPGFFDQDDEALENDYMDSVLELAEALIDAGVANADVVADAATLRAGRERRQV